MNAAAGPVGRPQTPPYGWWRLHDEYESSPSYYAGNWPTSLWLFRKDTGAQETLDRDMVKTATMPVAQLTRIYGREMAEYMMEKVLAFRSMHSHGRALNGLLDRAVQDIEDYEVQDGEWTAGVVAGWNFGEGHLHHEQLLEAVVEVTGRGEARAVRAAVG